MSAAEELSGLIRPELGDFNSIVCFKALVVGVEEALGERAAAVGLKAAGRQRGLDLVTSLGLAGSAPADPMDTARALNAALGVDGTRLCIVDQVTATEDGFRVSLREAVCSAGEPQGSPRELVFTLGAIHGAIEAVYNKKYRAKQVESVLRGGTHDVVELVPR